MMLKDSINKGSRPKYKVDLVARIHLAWKEFSTKTLEVLIASMPHCMMAVINAKGGSTRMVGSASHNSSLLYDFTTSLTKLAMA
jgi:hypothetical protein